MFLLDTNVLSELWRPTPSERVLRWLYGNDWLIPVPVLAELQEGAQSAKSTARRLEINAWIDALLLDWPESFVSWDAETARTWGRLQHSPEVKRQPQALWDSLIDALAVRHEAVVATRNVQDFRHARTFNPWED